MFLFLFSYTICYFNIINYFTLKYHLQYYLNSLFDSINLELCIGGICSASIHICNHFFFCHYLSITSPSYLAVTSLFFTQKKRSIYCFSFFIASEISDCTLRARKGVLNVRIDHCISSIFIAATPSRWFACI